jgi:hypothetical protein
MNELTGTEVSNTAIIIMPFVFLPHPSNVDRCFCSSVRMVTSPFNYRLAPELPQPMEGVDVLCDAVWLFETPLLLTSGRGVTAHVVMPLQLADLLRHVPVLHHGARDRYETVEVRLYTLSTIGLQRSRCKGWFLWPTPYTYIWDYTFSCLIS